MFFLLFYISNCIFATTTPPNGFSTPTGTPRGYSASGVDFHVPSYCGSFEDVITRFLRERGVGIESFDKTTVPGQNHSLTAIIRCFIQGFPSDFFVMQRRRADYPEGPPSLFWDLANSSLSFGERCSRQQAVMAETGIVPLLERLLQYDPSREGRNREMYIEFYPHIPGPDGASFIKRFIGDPTKVDELLNIVGTMAKQTVRMFTLGSDRDVIHADCHPGNFLVCDDDRVLAIDCRGPLVEGKAPALLFLEKLAVIILQKLGENIREPSAFEELDKTYPEIFTRCRKAFIDGMEDGLRGEEWMFQMSHVLSPDAILVQTKNLEDWRMALSLCDKQD